MMIMIIILNSDVSVLLCSFFYIVITLSSAGYSRDTSFLEMVVDIIQELKKANPSLVYGKCKLSYFTPKCEL